MPDTSRLYQVVDPVPTQPSRYGLINSATVINEADAHWEQGITWTPETCAEDGGTFNYCNSPATEFTYNGVPTAGQFIPFGIYASAKCHPGSGLDIRARAVRALELQESRLIEREFWTGAVATAADPDHPNKFLAAAAAVQPNGTTATPAALALADLEQALADCAGGGRGFIHARPRTVTFWQHMGLLRREGSLLLTALDTIVVPGRGYPGTSPTGVATANHNTDWAYATGQVEVRRGPVQVLETEASVTQANTDNTHRAVAYRMASATFDPCCHIGVLVKNCSLQDCA